MSQGGQVMDIRSSLDGLKALLGVAPATPASTPHAHDRNAPEGSTLTTDSATLSSAGSEVAQTVREGGVRPDKVAWVQAALIAGTYEVPASAVAAKVVDAMLGQGT
jgi:anti-sigma28 factor (negative regulator of flagellin synthesis)